MALEAGTADLDKVYDVTQPLNAGPYTITDLHPQNRPLSVREIFLHSSNVGAGMLARELGAERQRALLDSFGLLETMRTEAGPVAPPQLPKNWGDAETITIAYGHGLAVAPLQFAAAVAALVNGGNKVTPTLLAGADARAGNRRAWCRRRPAPRSARSCASTSPMPPAPAGAPRPRAIASAARPARPSCPDAAAISAKALISSFVGAFPMDAPKYVTLVMLFEPQTGAVGGDQATAGLNAAPATARIVERVAPLLGVLPRRLETRGAEGPSFDAPRGAQ